MKVLFAFQAYRIRQEITGRLTKMARSLPFVQMSNVFKILTGVLTTRFLLHSSVSASVPNIFRSDKKIAAYERQARRNACGCACEVFVIVDRV